MNILSLIVAVAFIGLACWAVRTMSSAFKVPEPVSAIAYVVLVVIFVAWVLQSLGAGHLLTTPLHF